MRCPFLREEQVKSCQAAPFRKALARSAARGESERCSSPAYVSCPMLRRSHEDHPNPSRCPFLRESLAQFCAATPRPAYVPWSESPELRCAHDGHRYCETFMAVAGGSPRVRSADRRCGGDDTVHAVSGVPVPGWLHYSESHFWLDLGDDDICHVGLDAFLAQLVGEIDQLAFVVVKGTARPSVVLTTRGLQLTLIFEQPLALVTANTRLRSNLDRLVADPYGRGWLFEARVPTAGRAGTPAQAAADLTRDLRSGPEAREWMASEVRRVSEHVHATLAEGESPALAADGGRFARGLLAGLDPEAARRLLQTLFPRLGTRRIR